MLNGKWSSQKFQDEQINEKFGVAFSDGDICIFCYNINVESIQATNLRFNWLIIIELYNVRNMPGKALKWGTLVKKTCHEW
jgi:hypothetical protein